MKRIILPLLIFYTFCCTATSYDPVLAVVLMVKNEESVIVETIEPFVKGGIDSFLILDTGSTDNTLKRLQEYFDQEKITNAHIIQEPFVTFAVDTDNLDLGIDFSKGRNRALDLAKEYFPNAGFFVMPDAEWYIKNADVLLNFCKKELENNTKETLYLIRTGHDYVDFWHPRLFRASANIRFYGERHEGPVNGTLTKVSPEVFFEWRPADKGMEKSRRRWETDLLLLFKKYNQNPYDSRTIFYLAQTYELLGDYYNAAHFYKLRASFIDYPEERYMGLYRLAGVLDKLSEEDASRWPEAMDCYLQAFTSRPTRAEPLIKIAQHYLNQDNHQLAYLFARRACEIPYPDQEILFVDKFLYTCERYDIVSRSAWYIGEFEIGEWAASMALMAYPQIPHLQTNLNFYIQRRLANSHA